SRNTAPIYQTPEQPSRNSEPRTNPPPRLRCSACALGLLTRPKPLASPLHSTSTSDVSNCDAPGMTERSRLAACPRKPILRVALLASSPSGHTTDELSQPTLGQMMTGECGDSLIDDGFNDQETM